MIVSLWRRLSRPEVFYCWHKMFSESREDVEHDNRSEHRKTAITDDNVKKIKIDV